MDTVKLISNAECCRQFINLVYAKGKVTITECIDTLVKRGLMTSDYGGSEQEEAECLLSQDLEFYCRYLNSENEMQLRANLGDFASGIDWDTYAWGGRKLEPCLDSTDLQPSKFGPKKKLAELVALAEERIDDQGCWNAAADFVRDQGFDDYANWLLTLPTLRVAYDIFLLNDDKLYEKLDGLDTWRWLDRVPWRLTTPWRLKYRYIPVLSHFPRG